MLRALALAVALLASGGAWAAPSCPTSANTTPAFTAGGSLFGRIASQWDSYFGAKVDANNGVLCNPTIVGGSIPGGGADVTLSNVTLPTGRDNLNAGLIKRSVLDFGAKCDVQYLLGGTFSIPAGGTTVTLLAGAFVDVGVEKLVILPGHAAGGQPLITTLTPTDTGHAELGAPSVPGTIAVFSLPMLSLGTGTGYAPGHTVTMAGGTLAATGGIPTVGTVISTYVRTVVIANGGTGGTNGTHLIYGADGNGNRAILSLTVAGGIATAVNLTDPGTDGGHYTHNPDPDLWATSEPGVTLPSPLVMTLGMDIDLIRASTPGLYANGGYPATFTQASSSGGGTGATFTAMGAFNSGGLVYGTDDSAAFNLALNPTTWPAPNTAQNGATIELPATPCGIANTVIRNDSGVELRGTANVDIAIPDFLGTAIRGSAVQWLGDKNGLMFTENSITNGKLTGVGFSGGVPNSLGSGNMIPIAATGLNVYGSAAIDYGYLSFEGFTSYDVYVTGSPSRNTVVGSVHDVDMYHPLYAEATGIYLTTNGGSGFDTVLVTLERIVGSYQSAPLIRLNALDNNRVGPVGFFNRGTQREIYGLDISGGVYGSPDLPAQSNTLWATGISSTSIARGKESSATPPTNIKIDGFDPTNSIPVIVERPGGGSVIWIDYNGLSSFPTAAPLDSSRTLATTKYVDDAVAAGGGGLTGTVQSGTGPAIAQYPGGTGTTVGPATISGDATLAAGGALTIVANVVSNAKLATMAANTVKANVTSGTAVPTNFAMPSCSTAGSALKYMTSTGFGCNTAIDAATLLTKTFGAPGDIGGTTPVTALYLGGPVRGSGRIVSGTTDTPAAADCGTTIHFTSGSAITVTMPNNITLALGQCLIEFAQEGAGQITFTAAGGATIHSFDGFTKTAGQWTEMVIRLNTNAGGTSAVYTLSGRGV